MIQWKALPPLASLRAFAAFAETGKLVDAASVLNVSHAAISQQIRTLEAHLGLPLVDRSARQLALSDEGKALAQALLSGFETMSDTIAELTGFEADRPLHITTTPSFASGWLMPRLARFRAAHPDIDVTIDPNPGLRDPAPGGVDVGLRFGTGEWPGFEAQLLAPTGIAVVAAPSLIGEKGPNLTRIGDYPWLQELGTSETSFWIKGLGAAGPRRGALLELPGNLLLEAARAGQGIAVTATIWAREDIAAGRLVLLHEAESPNQGYHIVTRPGLARPPLKAFLRWIRREIRSDQKKPTSQM